MRSASVSTFIVAIALGSTLMASSAQSQQVDQRTVRPPNVLSQRLQIEPETDAVFIQGGERHRVRIAPGRIGVVARESAARELAPLQDLRRSLRASAIAGFDTTTVFATPAQDLRSFAQLTEAARDLKARYRNVVQDAGVLIFIGQARTPVILTDQIIVQLRDARRGRAAMDALASRDGYGVVGANPFEPGQFVVELQRGDARHALAVSNALNSDPNVAWAHPNFYAAIDYRQAAFVPNDALFANQWHLNNTGQNGGTVDADIDADFAWGISRGNANIVVAVLDDAVQFTHPDLQPNLFTNPGETPANGVDDDANGFIDDVNGWDFTACAGTLPCGDNNPGPGAGDTHGTSVAGGAVARGDNAIGVSGSCPNCRMLPVRGLNGPVLAHAMMFGYARTRGAHIVTNSWGYAAGTPNFMVVTNAITNAATNGRGGLGSVVLFAMNNPNVNDCGANPDISAQADVIAVSRSSNRDRFDRSGFGNCMDVLAPTRSAVAAFGTLSGVTTDLQGAAGTNNAALVGGCTETGNNDYTFCFGGTSFATPVTAGSVGLILSVDNTRSRVAIQRVLQDTADRIEHSLGAYSEINGFSSPATGQATHGFGRINAFEAVRLMAPVSAGGRGGVDLVIRDNRLDWGNTEQASNVTFEPTRGFIPHWESVDIKVDAPPYVATPTTSAQFDAFVHENPQSSMLNRVYVRVRNRGPTTATNVTVKLHWAFAGAALPALPSDFWSAFPAHASDTSVWHPMNAVTAPAIAYSGASVAGGASDGAVIVSFDFNAPLFDPSLPNPNHYCLFAIVDAASDGVSAASRAQFAPDVITPRDNNVTHRNVYLADSGIRSREQRFVLANPFPYDVESIVSVRAPRGVRVALSGVEQGQRVRMRGGENRVVALRIDPVAALDGPASVVVEQRLYREQRELLVGGMTFVLPSGLATTLRQRPPVRRQ